jgi:hypothetical protein
MLLALKLSLSLSRESDGVVMMSDDSNEWAGKFLTRLANKHQAANDAGALLMQKRGMIHSEAPLLMGKATKLYARAGCDGKRPSAQTSTTRLL